jgi:hypothetical protein
MAQQPAGTPGAAFREAYEADFDSSTPSDGVLVHAIADSLDLIAALEERVSQDGLTVTGSAGQPVAHPLIAELRQQRAALARLLSALGLEDAPAMTFSQRQRQIAQKRWNPPTAASRRKKVEDAAS